ncbi:hypothetical protein ACFSM7_05865 [Clavibacter michiganensis subsp. tessellarius]|uniref:hypothetical protein n=1 Tax=Clavibacter tessellarius TaxID=31965 RepID=UPI00363E8526
MSTGPVSSRGGSVHVRPGPAWSRSTSSVRRRPFPIGVVRAVAGGRAPSLAPSRAETGARPEISRGSGR